MRIHSVNTATSPSDSFSVGGSFDQQRFLRLARHQCRAARASFLQTFRRVDAQASPLNLFSVTRVAALHKNRANPLFEKLGLPWIGLACYFRGQEPTPEDQPREPCQI